MGDEGGERECCGWTHRRELQTVRHEASRKPHDAAQNTCCSTKIPSCKISRQLPTRASSSRKPCMVLDRRGRRMPKVPTQKGSVPFTKERKRRREGENGAPFERPPTNQQRAATANSMQRCTHGLTATVCITLAMQRCFKKGHLKGAKGGSQPKRVPACGSSNCDVIEAGGHDDAGRARGPAISGCGSHAGRDRARAAQLGAAAALAGGLLRRPVVAWPCWQAGGRRTRAVNSRGEEQGGSGGSGMLLACCYCCCCCWRWCWAGKASQDWAIL